MILTSNTFVINFGNLNIYIVEPPVSQMLMIELVYMRLVLRGNLAGGSFCIPKY